MLRKIFLAFLCGFFAVSCSDAQEVSSYQQTTVQNGVIPFGNELPETSSSDSQSDLFDGFAVEQDVPDTQQSLSADKSGEPPAVVTSKTTTRSTVDAAIPDPVPAAPKATTAATPSTLNPATTQKPLLPVTFKSAGSYIWLSTSTNKPTLVIQMTLNCDAGQEYFVEASIYQDNSLLLTDSEVRTCIASLAFFRSIPIEYVEGADYRIDYKISQNGKVVAETSAPTTIRL